MRLGRHLTRFYIRGSLVCLAATLGLGTFTLMTPVEITQWVILSWPLSAALWRH